MMTHKIRTRKQIKIAVENKTKTIKRTALVSTQSVNKH